MRSRRLICAGAGASALSACDIRRITLRMAVLVVALGASLAAPASADNREVLVRDFIGFTPTKAAVKPSESVTWNQQSASGEGHNVVFEDGSSPRRSGPSLGLRRGRLPRRGLSLTIARFTASSA